MLKVAGGGGGGGSGTVTQVDTGTGLTGGPITATGTISLANTAVTAGVYGNSGAIAQVTIDAQGRITNASNVTIVLANTTVTAGVYGNASTVGTFTVDAQGRLTAAANATISVTAAQVTGSNITLGNTTLTLGGTTTSVGNLTLANANISATTNANATFATSSLPLIPEGYITILINGTSKKIPYYGV